MREYVYVMHDGENYKIGMSHDVAAREEKVAYEWGSFVRIILSIGCKDARGCERHLHSLFQEYSIGGEWFNFPDASFLHTVLDVCTQNITSDSLFFAKESAAMQEALDIQSILDTHYAVSYRYVAELTEHKYSATLCVLIMKRMGCIVDTSVSSSSRIYITKLGQEAGVDKLSRKELRKVKDKPVHTERK